MSKGDIFMIVMAALLMAALSTLVVVSLMNEIQQRLDRLEKNVCECAQKR